MLATFMEVLDTSVANVALPHIAGSLSATADEATWVLTSYLVSNAIILPMGGWFSMLFGRKRFYMICVGLFTVSSLLCGMAPTLGLLIVFRVLQGIGGGALQPISQAILVESFPREKQGMAMAVYGMGVVVAPVIGPTLGGWITDNFSWRWIFFINIPVGILSLVLTSSLIHDPPYLVRKRFGNGFKIDYMGFGLLALGLGSLEIVLDEGQRNDWFSSNFIVTFAILTAVCLVGVVVWELRQKQPMIDFHVLKDRNFALATGSMLVLGFVLYGSTALLPLFLQTLLGYTAMLSGMVLSPGGIVICVGMPVVGFLLRRYQARWLVIFGVVVSAVGLIAHVALHPAGGFRHRGPGTHCAELRPGLSVRAHQHGGLHADSPRADELRHRPLQSGAQHRRQFGNRRHHHHPGAARAVSPIGAGFAPDAVRRRLSRRSGEDRDGPAGGGFVRHRRGRASAGNDVRHAAEAVQHAGLCRRLLGDGNVVPGDHSADVPDSQNTAGARTECCIGVSAEIAAAVVWREACRSVRGNASRMSRAWIAGCIWHSACDIQSRER